MKLIIGLGNPGGQYKSNRHNVGHIVIDALASGKVRPSKLNLYKGLTLKKSDKFMNDSGSFVSELVSRFQVLASNLYVIHDDLDIRLGEFKIQFGKGPKVHNGLNDIYDNLGNKDFWHVRVGIDSRTKDQRLKTKGEEYVLEDFTDEEKVILDKVIKEICKKLETL